MPRLRRVGWDDRQSLGLIFAGLCAVNGAFVPAFAKLTTDRADPVFVATVTSCFAGVFASGVLWWRGRMRPLVQRATGPRLLTVGALGTAVAFVLFYAGASRSSAIETVLCLQVEPVYALLFAWMFLGHRPTRVRVLATAVLLLGIFLAVGGEGLVFSEGVWLLLATPLCWQASHLIVLRGLAGVEPAVITGARYIYGGLLLAAYWLLGGAGSHISGVGGALGRLGAYFGGAGGYAASAGVDLGAAGPVAGGYYSGDWYSLLALLALQGLVLTYVGTLLWYSAISRLDLARTTAIVVPSIPLLSLGASFLLLAEVPTARQWLGLVLSAAGVLAFVSAGEAEPDIERIPSPTAPVSAAADVAAPTDETDSAASAVPHNR